jgi:MIP family channel proteins
MAGHLRSYIVELIGTFMLVFFGAGAVCIDVLTGGKLGWTGMALAYGLSAMAAGYAFSPISGGHFNPAVTVALLINRRISAVKSIFYVVSQLFGAALAAAALGSVLIQHPALSESSPYLGACDLSGIGFKAGTLLEAIGTFLLVSVFYGTQMDARGCVSAAPIAMGLVYTISALVLGPLTGAALNPARSFGPAAFTGHWSHAYVYWIGPITGALAAACLYEKLCLEKK